MGKKISVDRRWGPSFIYLVMAVLMLGACATSPITQPAAEKPDIPIIESIKVNPSAEQTVVEVMSNAPAPFTSFKLVDPPRVVLDIRGKPGENLPRKTSINGGNVQEIRIVKGETQATTTRVVVTLSKALEYEAVTEDKSIKLTLAPKPEETQAQKAESMPVVKAEPPTVKPSEPRIFFKPKTSDLDQWVRVSKSD